MAEPEFALAGRAGYWPRDKVLGGSSSINAMVFVRGQHEDFDDWRALGNADFNGVAQEGAGCYEITVPSAR